MFFYCYFFNFFLFKFFFKLNYAESNEDFFSFRSVSLDVQDPYPHFEFPASYSTCHLIFVAEKKKGKNLTCSFSSLRI